MGIGPEAEWAVRTGAAAETAALGRRLGMAARAGDALLLSGVVGAGKTVLAGGILTGLGVPGPHPSPTFTIVRTYHGRLHAAHLDLYRLDGGLDAEEIGLEDILAGEGVAVVEWAERLGALTPPDALYVRLERVTAGDERQILLAPSGPGAMDLVERARRVRAGGWR